MSFPTHKLWMAGVVGGLACGGGAPPPAKSVADKPAEPSVPGPAAPRELPAFCAEVGAEPPLDPQAQATLVQDGFVFVEGPVWSESAQAFFFSEMDFNNEGPNGPPAKIHKLTLPSDVQVFVESSGSNGLAVDATGLVACTHDTQTLSRYDLTSGARSALVTDYQGKHFNSPNDVALHSEGHIYFTDPDWQLGERENQTGVTGLYRVTPDGVVELIDGSLSKPNGVTLSPDETRLYVGAVDGVIRVYPVLSDGSVGEGQTFAEVKEPDGMAVDCAGNLYVASHGPGEVVVHSPAGEVISRIQAAPRTTNVAFGGEGRRTLLITAGSGVYSIQTQVPGFPY